MYSSLVDKFIPSQFYSNRNGTIIDRVTIHHMAGNLSIETCGNVFQRKGRNASSNYGIGSDGRIGCYVEEEYRSWCSSNRANDMRAITIEVANDVFDSTWHVSDKAMDSLIRLLADVCTRYNILPLKWDDRKNYRVGNLDGANMTIHRDFSKTLCPGPYLFSKQSFIAEEVNKLCANHIPEEPKNENHFLVRITCNVLNIRSSAGTAYKIKGTVKRGEVFTIIETQKVGSILWGRLKSNAGWICLKYTEPVNLKL